MAMKTYTIREAAAELMRQMCNDNSFGYNSPNYYTGGTITKRIFGRDVAVPAGDYDCGGSIRMVYSLLGVDIAGASSTNDMRVEMCDEAKTFVAHPWDDDYEMQIGDLTLWEHPQYNGYDKVGHVAMCVEANPAAGYFKLGEFVPGDYSLHDQGNEGRIVYYYNYTGSVNWEDGWHWCLALKDEYGSQFWSTYSSDRGRSTVTRSRFGGR